MGSVEARSSAQIAAMTEERGGETGGGGIRDPVEETGIHIRGRRR